jgi:hypothetical protein
LGIWGAVSKNKIKIIQGIIQVECSINWSIDNKIKIANLIKCLEIYSAKKISKVEVTNTKWDSIPNNKFQQ